ncbi:ribosomal protein S18-alanine N-acetyltransferase [Clostridium sp. HCP1S3_B4]|uniref:ribosomal protein S18-alanine N-acetyltransferase n=1 Tax=unclassified Clostridium TaxID=2614128 RepID=UPI0016A03CA2|nr:ribosomal protein S18-alanine N-acetyltransferase [Clostridiales bacterium]MDY2730233.1 ribosomal protein S18-alanine N-acetyltransferase [Clostridium sp.]NLK23952.1 ribosomal protein S18-alanine N-acetyltransferase [Clostridiales bacterium]
MNYNTRLMNEKDILDVLDVGNLSLREAWTLESLKKELQNPLAKYIVISSDSKVIAFAGLWIVAGEGQITNIAVHPNCRGKGLGNKLMEALINNMNTWNCNSLTLEVRNSNIIAKKLYSKYGFIEEGIRKNYYHNDDGTKEDAIIMWLR